ncbi:hypothetical protein HK100_000445 [Physocladia obscura]|uniref:Vacuolar calcium ion transporter n=1 Tax=Physocladia obscura TaxID=109957 RepID=A0AAD5XJV8_9FUNG|nr:hypothetical protein HK100_000445 [Physocladia obscura]
MATASNSTNVDLPPASDIATFCLNCLAIIPLAKVLDYTTDQLSMRVGETIGGLLNATFGNAVELIVGVIALKQGLLRVLQASIIGSILSNLLLVLGFCFFLGSLRKPTVDQKANGEKGIVVKNLYQSFNLDHANVTTGLLTVVFLGFMVPAAFSAQGGSEDSTLHLSRGTAVMLLVTYVAFLIFQMYTNPEGLQVTPRNLKSAKITSSHAETEEEEEEEDEEVPDILTSIAFFGLIGATCLIGVCAEFLVDSLDGLSSEAGISHTFIGIIILPIVGNAAEHVTAVSSAMRNKMDLVIGVAVGSSMQVALLVAPILVLLGWIIGQPLTLDFEIFETAVLFVSIFVVTTLIGDGKSTWLEGWVLLTSYVIIALAFYFVQDTTN